MNAHNPFEPPRSDVADVVQPIKRPIVALVVLVLVAWYELAWMWETLRMYFRLVAVNALSPLGLIFAAVGTVFLCVGLAFVVLNGQRGALAMLVAACCLAITALVRHGQPGDDLAPLLMGITLAVAGWVLVLARKRALARQFEADRGDQ